MEWLTRLIDGELVGGEFRRQESRFRDWVGATRERSSRRLPGRGRPLPPVRLAGLPVVSSHRDPARARRACSRPSAISYLAPFRDERGWAFTGERFTESAPGTGAYIDELQRLGVHERGLHAPPTRRSTGASRVPVLWDTRDAAQIVNNESTDIIRMFDAPTRSARSATRRVDLYPPALRARDRRDQRARLRRPSTTASTAAGFARTPGRLRARLRARCSTTLRLARGAARRAPLPARATRSPRPTGACFRRSCASTRSTTCHFQLQPAAASSTTPTCGATRASCTSWPGDRGRRSRWSRSSATTTRPTTS